MSFDRFARLRPFATRRDFYVAWFDLGRACNPCTDDYRPGAVAARQRRRSGRRIRLGRIGHGVRCARYEHIVFEVDRRFCGPVLRHQFDVGVSRLARAGGAHLGTGTCRTSRRRCSADESTAAGTHAHAAAAARDRTGPGAESNATAEVTGVNVFFLPARSAANVRGSLCEPREKFGRQAIDIADVAKLVDALV
jgi:hypothetical protein